VESDAVTFVAPEDEDDLRGIEKAFGRTIARVTLPDFDYNAPPPPKIHAHEDGRRPRSLRRP
jgi:ATP-dependent RNA helicase RhlE